MRFEQLLEAKNVYDFRHEDISAELSIWPKQAQGSYVDPRDGFYWIFSKGNLLIFSTENESYSFVANMYQSASDEEKAIAKSDVKQFVKIPRIQNAHKALASMWNQLSGVVIFSTMTLTILKESSRGDTMRQRVIANIAEFKQALGSLKSFGVTDEFTIKGAPADIPKTVGQALQMQDYVQKTFQDKNLVMWHGTSEARLEFISKKGLRPGHTGEAYNDLIPNYSEHNVYLATTPKTAQFYAKRQAKKYESAPIVLKIKVPNPNKLIADDRFARYGGEIAGHRGDRIKASVKEMGELAYKGWIPPKFISKK